MKFKFRDSVITNNPENYLYIKNRTDIVLGIKGTFGFRAREDFNKHRLIRNSIIENECYEETMNWHLKDSFKISTDKNLEQFFIQKFGLNEQN